MIDRPAMPNARRDSSRIRRESCDHPSLRARRKPAWTWRDGHAANAIGKRSTRRKNALRGCPRAGRKSGDLLADIRVVHRTGTQDGANDRARALYKKPRWTRKSRAWEPIYLMRRFPSAAFGRGCNAQCDFVCAIHGGKHSLRHAPDAALAFSLRLNLNHDPEACKR